MDIFRKAEINARVNTIIGNNDPFFINYLVENIRKEKPENYKYSIFLSHSHHDAELVKKIVLILKQIGVEVYVDWMDDSMPVSTCGITATKIKQKIKQNHKFIFLATNISIDSKWCNWEIGYGDADKYQDDDIAVFPVRMIIVIGKVMSTSNCILQLKNQIIHYTLFIRMELQCH